MRKTLFLAFACGLLAALAGCTTLPMSNSADRYGTQQAQQIEKVRLGTIIAVRKVTIAPSDTQTATGTGVGALVGALLGRSVGQGKGRTLATVAGAVAGGAGGNAVAKTTATQPGLLITVKLDGGETLAVTQAADVRLAVGRRVELVGSGYSGSSARVLPIGAVPK